MCIAEIRVAMRVGLLRVLCLSTVLCPLAASAFAHSPAPSSTSDSALLVQVDAPVGDVLKAVQEVTNDQIIHGTYSYEKEKILYGAHPAESSRALGSWQDPGQVFYKVADRVLAPRFFKNSGDIGSITIRYVVQEASPTSTSLRIDAIFIDARSEKHVSTGNVEAQEYAAIQDHLRDLQSRRNEEKNAEQEIARRRQQAETTRKIASIEETTASGAGSEEQMLERKIHELRRQIEMRLRLDTALKAAPFRSASTIASLPAETEVVVMVVTPYWFGVETQDGHRGWIHRSELESFSE